MNPDRPVRPASRSAGRPALVATLAALALCLAAGWWLLAGRAPDPAPARIALWEVHAPDGRRGWLLGTIHAAERPYAWRTLAIARAATAARSLVVETADAGDHAKLAAAFAALSRSPGHPALVSRVPPNLRARMEELAAAAGLDPDAQGDLETWAAALTLAHAANPSARREYGIDAALIAEARSRKLPVVELEGTRVQLAVFDALSEQDQRTMLRETLAAPDAASQGGDLDLERAWARGDMEGVARGMGTGLLADPGLRHALLDARNARWAAAIAARIRAGEAPLVAVGAAHLAGRGSLQERFEQAGFIVQRVQ